MILLLQPGKFTLDLRCVRAAETLAGENPLVAILNIARNLFDESIAECQCYAVEDSTNPLMHNVTRGIQVTRCSTPLSQNITAQFIAQ